MRHRVWPLALLLTAACSDDEPHVPEPPPPGGLTLAFEAVPFPTDLSYITDLKFAPGGSSEAIAIDLYGGYEVVELTADGMEVVASGMIPDVFAEYDSGQLAVAFDPAFADNDMFYIAANIARNQVLVRRYTLDRSDADATLASAVTILDLEVPSSPRWHNISSMGFDEEGLMWLLVGDKGLSLPDQDPETTVAQDPSNLLGTLMRIAPSTEAGVGGYTVPSSVVPYSADGDPAVVAIGIRSPWKGVYHEGKWVFGDVGLDDVEEINVLEGRGENLGWPVLEGTCADDVFGNMPSCDDFHDPFLHYGRSASHEYVLDDLDAVPTNKRSVYAGWIYQPRGDDPYAGRWNDVLVWGDAFVGFMRAAPLDGGGESWHLAHAPFPSAWAQGPDGFVYMIGLSDEPPSKNPDDVSGLPSPLYRAVLADP